MTRFFGGLLLAIGALLAGTTGLCTGGAMLIGVSALLEKPGEMISASPLLLIGIVPCVLGIFMARAGLAMMRAANRIDPDQSSP